MISKPSLIASAIVVLIGIIMVVIMSKPVIKEGDICYIGSDKGDYGVIKILKIEEIDGVKVYHTRIYKEHFTEPPKKEQLVNLSLGTVYEKEFGIGHTPLSEKTLFSWNPVPVKNEPVTEEELEGYYEWRKYYEWSKEHGEGEPGVFG